jgi:hypothetical protein
LFFETPPAFRAIIRITLDMGEFSSAIGVGVFCVRRAVA